MRPKAQATTPAEAARNRAGGVVRWPFRPLIAGDWKEVPEELRSGIAAGLTGRDPAAPLHPRRDLVRMRALRLAAHPGCYLIEGLAASDAAGRAVFRLLYGSQGPTMLDGTSEPLHRFNATQFDAGLDEDAATQYLHLFTSAVRGADGRFHLVESVSELGLPATLAPAVRRRLARGIRRLAILPPGEDGRYRREATVAYAGRLFHARFAIARNGQVDMLDDDPGAELPEPLAERFDGIWQFDWGEARPRRGGRQRARR